MMKMMIITMVMAIMMMMTTIMMMMMIIMQPITRERCEVIPRGATAAAQSEDESQSMPQIQYFPFG